MLNVLTAALEDVCGLIFPNICHSCHARADRPAPLCPSCEAALCEPAGTLCYACNPQSVLSLKLADKHVCAVPGHEHFRVASGLLMRGPAADVIHAFKYAGATGVAHFLARRSLRAWRELSPSPPDFFTAVPLHRARLKERGYNQSLLLAMALTRLTGVMAAPELLVRARPTRPQVGLPPHLRTANVEGAFVVPIPGAVKGRRVTIVDDVATTGATLRACAAALLDAGVSGVTALVGAIS